MLVISYARVLFCHYILYILHLSLFLLSLYTLQRYCCNLESRSSRWSIHNLGSICSCFLFHFFLFIVGFFYWARGDAIDEAVIWGSENRGGFGINLCHSALWSCSILSLWWNRCSTWSSVQNRCWKYPFYIVFSLFLFY